MSEPGSLTQARRAFAARFGDRQGTRQWWVPGRIEVLGKHTDYAGGRSLLAAVERGFHVVARPRRDGGVNLVDARSQQAYQGRIDAALEPAPGRWMDYPVSVLRRLARDFPGATTGMDAALCSSLPSASGLSSSSALVIATFLPLMAFNRLEEHPAWQGAFTSPDDLAGYLGAVENGRAFGPFPGDFGVGTQGGSEDHTAILRCEAGMLAGYRFVPVTAESCTALPSDWTFVIAASGVTAAKAGAVKSRYNHLSAETATLIDSWNRAVGSDHASLLDILLSREDAVDHLTALVATHPDGEALQRRLGQFNEECLTIIPGVVEALGRGDAARIGTLVDRSHHLASTVLGNQIAETDFLARRARELGAIAASAFGAGFGGSVWALVARPRAEEFAAAWREGYTTAFPQRIDAASVFVSDAASGAHEVRQDAPAPMATDRE